MIFRAKLYWHVLCLTGMFKLLISHFLDGLYEEDTLMAVPATKLKEKKEIIDEGLEQGAARLTYGRIEQVINQVLKGETGARMKVYVNTCIHCGLCSTACHHYLSNNGDPEFSPVAKVKRTMWEMLEKKGKVSPAFIKKASEIASTECNLCRRCSMFCPYGIDIAYIMSIVRRICHLLGVTPLYIQDTAHSHAVTMNQMWVKEDEWADTLQWQEGEAQAEIPRLRISLDKEGSDIMYSVIGPEPRFLAHLIYNAAIIYDRSRRELDHAFTSGLGQQRYGHVHR